MARDPVIDWLCSTVRRLQDRLHALEKANNLRHAAPASLTRPLNPHAQEFYQTLSLELPVYQRNIQVQERKGGGEESGLTPFAVDSLAVGASDLLHEDRDTMPVAKGGRDRPAQVHSHDCQR